MGDIGVGPSPARGPAAVGIGRRPVEIVSLTSLRGFLATWVVLYHFWGDVTRLVPGAARWSPLVHMGHMAVPAFFMLSGFVLAYNYAERFHRFRGPEFARFLGLRLARIYPVHLFTLLVVAVMVGVSGRVDIQLPGAGYTMRDFVLNVFLVHTWVPYFSLNWNYPSWSISSEWFAYLVFPAAVAGFLRHLTTPARALLAGGIALAGSIAVMIGWRPWPFYELVLVVPTFFAGTAVYWFLRDQPGFAEPGGWRWAPEVLALAVGASCFLLPPRLVTTTLLCSFLALILALAWLGPDCHRLWSAWPAVFLGEASYSLYMTHTLAQKVVYRLLPSARFESAGLPTRLGVIAIYAVLVVACCLGTYFAVESPCRHLFKRMLGRKARRNDSA